MNKKAKAPKATTPITPENQQAADDVASQTLRYALKTIVNANYRKVRKAKAR
jgi:hypothetical protein